MEQHYTRGLNVELTLGEAKAFEVRDWIAATIVVHRICANAPCEGFVKLEDVVVDNVSVLMKRRPNFRPESAFATRAEYEAHFDKEEKHFETNDAHYFSVQHKSTVGEEGWGRAIEPTLCEHGVAMRISYSGLVPEGYERGRKFLFGVSFSGPMRNRQP